jgi:quercetin dioxygenase-like cupin family protein
MSDHFRQSADITWTDLGNGLGRAVLCELPELMMVAFSFPKGGIGAPHSHPHVQSSYVAEGSFDVTIDGETRRVDQGGSFIVPTNTVHGVTALEAGLLIDAFTPRRDDFL